MNVNILLDINKGQPTGSEPVTTAEVKAQLKITFTADDALIEALIPVARDMIEQYTGVSIVQRKVAVVAKMAGSWMELPYGPVDPASVVVSTVGIGGSTPETVETDAYSLIGTGFVSILMNNVIPAFGDPGIDTCWPFGIVYDAGYTDLPPNLRGAVLHQAVYLYEHRGDENDIDGMSPTAMALAKLYRRVVI